MPDLLIELRSEEIPARMQRKAAGDLKKLVTDGLVEAGLTYEAAREYWTPRRLALDIRGLTARSRDVREEIKGPATSAPEQAVLGFLRKAGLASVNDAHVHSDPKKGDFYIAHIVKPGRAAEAVIAALMPEIIRAFPWPKSMRWGAASARPGALRWVRPLQSIICLLAPDHEEPQVVRFEADGVVSGNVTFGHRFHAPAEITVKRFDDYVSSLERAFVVLDAERRKQIILSDARTLAFANGLELVEDDGLLEEVSGLVEWPVVLLGSFEEEFLAIPPEVIRLTIRANQKCFVCRPFSPLEGEMSPKVTEGGQNTARNQPPSALPGISPARGENSQSGLAPHFILTANIEAADGGAEIMHGNGKVVRARLSDAVHFWKTDQANVPDLGQLADSAAKFGLDLGKPLDQRMARLDHLGVTFHAKLGTQGERVSRIARLAEEIAVLISPSSGPSGHLLPGGEKAGARPSPLAGEGAERSEAGEGSLARRAAILCKADLQTEVVGEFPELQGLMGRKYAALQGEHPSVCAAIEDHYKPQGPADRVPSDPIAIAVALADKLDTLVGFWAIDEKPTGSKDPYALRRAALGVIRIVLENGIRIRIRRTAIAHTLHWLSRIDDFALSAPMIAYEGTEANSELKLLLKAAQSAPFVSAIVSPSVARIREIERLPDRGYDIESPKETWIARIDSLTEWVGRVDEFRSGGKDIETLTRIDALGTPLAEWASSYSSDLLAFFHDRLKVYLRDQGARHDLIEAVLSPSSGPSGHLLPAGEKAEAAQGETPPSPRRGEGAERSEAGEGGSPPDDLVLIARKVEALTQFIGTDEGANLLAGLKRSANILAAEEKKGAAAGRIIDERLLSDAAETALYEALNQASNLSGQALEKEDFSGAMQALSSLRGPVDSFFEAVHVNDENPDIRANRLALLAELRRQAGRIADFSKIAG